MIDIALRLPVFIASPMDVTRERDIVSAEVERLTELCLERRIVLEPVRWEKQARPGWGRPQDLLNPHVRRAELIIVILWSRLGSPATVNGSESGTEEEFRIAREIVARGVADDVFLYIRSSPPPPGACPESHARVRKFRQEVHDAKTLLACDYESETEFATLVRRHLDQWLERWTRVPEICEHALLFSPAGVVGTEALGENRLHSLQRLFDLGAHPDLAQRLGRAAVLMYQDHGPSGVEEPIPADHLSPAALWQRYALTLSDDAQRGLWSLLRVRTPPQPLSVTPDGAVYFSGPEWFQLFCAVGLIDAIERGDIRAVERVPYVNEVHQLLPLLVGPRRQRVLAVLSAWLANQDGALDGKPVVRNFAAYELGVLQAREAHEVLATAAETDRGRDVQLYCVAALGKLRSRRQLPLLVKLFFRVGDSHTRLMIAQAICRITGVVPYEL
ncbi:HEAT repeat domain-containing protein [Sorangium cellulosum]|uniref:HEAT repeat domain-containing protein n=1 Tax=Sorangium cellulosum TaxID=56 RepID=UPI003D9AADC0